MFKWLIFEHELSAWMDSIIFHFGSTFFYILSTRWCKMFISCWSIKYLESLIDIVLTFDWIEYFHYNQRNKRRLHLNIKNNNETVEFIIILTCLSYHYFSIIFGRQKMIYVVFIIISFFYINHFFVSYFLQI